MLLPSPLALSQTAAAGGIPYGRPNLDRLVFSRTLMVLADQIGETALRTAKETVERARQFGGGKATE
jgi:hypothetical protein